MQKTKQSAGVTFAVDRVTPATEPLPHRRTHEVLRDRLEGIESCHDYHGMVVDRLGYQPLLAAVYTAFSKHRPLVLSPDAVWITIAQGVAHHMLIHGERLRPQLVAHQGKIDLVFECRDWVEGSPENPWGEAFDLWAGQIRQHVGARIHDALVCDFSTSGPVERTASQIVMMDIFERYFHYALYCICGIPSVTLEGTPADWERLANKVEALEVFDLDWWLEHLRPICDQFVRASRGDVDLKHWRGICKLREEYGGHIINGWVAKLFPYLRAFTRGPCTRKNPIFESGEGFKTFTAPSGLSRVPFLWRDLRTGRQRMMEAVGGLVGVTQDPETLALRPKVGWAVRQADKMDVCLARLEKDHPMFPGSRIEERTSLPEDLCKFYHHANGAELFRFGDTAAYHIVPISEVKPLDWGDISEFLRDVLTPNGHIWYRLVDLADGSWLVINPRPEYPEPIRLRYLDDPGAREWDNFAAICHCHKDTLGQPGRNPVVALSFTELLERLLDSGGRPYWLDSNFAGYGDAELFTRRA